MKLQSKAKFKMSPRGWCYLMETERIIDKDEFDKVEDLMTRARKEGYLPVDFMAGDAARQFSGVDDFVYESPMAQIAESLRSILDGSRYYNLDWWNGETYYIQMIVEKVDLVSLFAPVCEMYHIPIANGKGWSSVLQRAEYARRFKDAESKGLKCVLLYAGDHDPDGLKISEHLRKTLKDLQSVWWNDEQTGYNPDNLIINRFGLNFDFIEANNLTWIDNLITGAGKDLANANHPNFKLPYVQDYLKKYGKRKCEANAIIVIPNNAQQLAKEAIENYLGHDAVTRFQNKSDAVDLEIEEWIEANGLGVHFNSIIDAT